MRSYDAATLAYFQGRAGIIARILIWAQARNRTTGAAETLGLWTGADERSFTIGGVPRAYVGAGAILQISPITLQTGLGVRMQRLSLSPLSQAVADLIRTHDARFAPVELHRALFSTEDGALIAEPHRVYKGFIDEVAVSTPAAGEDASCEVTMAGTARLLTRTLALKKSDASQRLRLDDRFRRHVDVSGAVDVWWGERRNGAKPGGGRGAHQLKGPGA